MSLIDEEHMIKAIDEANQSHSEVLSSKELGEYMEKIKSIEQEVDNIPAPKHDDSDEKWSTSRFFIGVAKVFVNMATVSWIVYTFLANSIMQRIFVASNGELAAFLTSPVMIILVSGWVVVSVIMGCNLQKAMSTMLENAKLNLEFKAGFAKNIDLKGSADAADVIKALKGL